MCPRINLSSFSRCEFGTPLLKLPNYKRKNNFTPASRGCKIVCKRVLFFNHSLAGYLTFLGSFTSM